jgi:hypothetical protein
MGVKGRGGSSPDNASVRISVFDPKQTLGIASVDLA